MQIKRATKFPKEGFSLIPSLISGISEVKHMYKNPPAVIASNSF